MIIKPLQPCSTTSVYNVAPGLRVTLEVDSNPHFFSLENLFQMALRNNPKRRFLFVSTLLGKHLPVAPWVPDAAGRALAACYAKNLGGPASEIALDELGAMLELLKMGWEPQPMQALSAKAEEIFTSDKLELSEQTLFIGFAETATALGYSVFSSFKNQARYIHTTRESLLEQDVLIRFEEEHSHATAHRLYTSETLNPLENDGVVVLVDDEITTGKTALNIIEAIQSRFPRKRYALLSLLDWRSAADRSAFLAVEQRLGIDITTVSLLSGQIQVSDDGFSSSFYEGCETENRRRIYSAAKSETEQNTLERSLPIKVLELGDLFSDGVQLTSISGAGHVSSVPYLRDTGRFGIGEPSSAQDAATWPQKTERRAKQAAKRLVESIDSMDGAWTAPRSELKWLCLGTGEFIQIPAAVARALAAELPDHTVAFHATTRSPICPIDQPGYGARTAYRFNCPEDPTVLNHVYNIEPGAYDVLVLMLERRAPEADLRELLEAVSAMQIAQVRLVFFSS